MTLSWKELVLHGLMKTVGEPSLANEIFKMVMKGRFTFLEEEAREFHSENIGPVIDIFNIYMSSCPSLSRDDLVRLAPQDKGRDGGLHKDQVARMVRLRGSHQPTMIRRRVV